MSKATKEQFDKLWNINSNVNEGAHNYENTFSLLNSILLFPRFTPDGKLVDFDLIYKRYKLYYQVKTTTNEGTDPKYIRKENRIKNIYEYLDDDLYNSVEKIPMTQRHFYFWGEHTEEDVSQLFSAFQKICMKT